MNCLSGNNRLFCLGFISLGILLILLGIGKVSEAKDTPSSTSSADIMSMIDVCDICHEDDVSTSEVDSFVERILQRTAMDVLIFQRDHVLVGLHREQLHDVQELLSQAQKSLQNGDSDTAQALVQHADQLMKELERQAKLGEHNSSVLAGQIGVLTQHETILDNTLQTRRRLEIVTGMGWTASAVEEFPLAQLMAASMHRRAPPDEDAFVAYNNINSMRNQETCYLS